MTGQSLDVTCFAASPDVALKMRCPGYRYPALFVVESPLPFSRLSKALGKGMIREIPNADLATIRVLACVIHEIEQQAAAAAPRECCGLLSGNGAVITAAHALRNESPKPETRYFAAPEDLLGAMRRMREAGRTLMGIYHSHPRTQAYPSTSDVQMAFYPEAVHFIISLESNVDIRAFRIGRGRIQGVSISVEDAG